MSVWKKSITSSASFCTLKFFGLTFQGASHGVGGRAERLSLFPCLPKCVLDDFYLLYLYFSFILWPAIKSFKSTLPRLFLFYSRNHTDIRNCDLKLYCTAVKFFFPTVAPSRLHKVRELLELVRCMTSMCIDCWHAKKKQKKTLWATQFWKKSWKGKVQSRLTCLARGSWVEVARHKTWGMLLLKFGYVCSGRVFIVLCLAGLILLLAATKLCVVPNHCFSFSKLIYITRVP